MPSFAAETPPIDSAPETFHNMVSGPAPQITSVKITDVSPGSGGHTMVEVTVMGYGSASIKLDGNRLDSSAEIDSTFIVDPMNVIIGFVYTYDCGVLEKGSHTFYVEFTSHNFPYKSKSDSYTFTV